MLIDNLQTPEAPDVYYDDKFRRVLEDHMTFLRNHPQTTIMTISPHEALKYQGDLYGLLEKKNVPPTLHWVTMRMNKMSSPSESSDSLNQMIITRSEVIDRIRSTHVTQNKIPN